MSSNDRVEIEFREYHNADFRSLCALDALCFSEEIAYPPEEIAAALMHPGTLARVAVADGRVVGFVLASRDRRRLGHIVTIDIHPEFRRQGVGAQLMELAEQMLRERGADRVVLEVATANEAALRFYEKRRYVRRQLLKAYYNDGSDAFLMDKMLK